MASPSNTGDLHTMALTGQEKFLNFLPLTEERKPHTFLSLAPVLSESYPAQPVFKAAKSDTSEKATHLVLTHEIPYASQTGVPAPVLNITPEIKTRRSSSVTSSGSAGSNISRRRFLRLGPVHFGISDGDWSEDVLEE